jgi:hypothetical protein
MVKLTVLYAHPEDPDAFEQYYANTHMPLVDEIPNLQRYEAARVVATPERLQGGMGSEEGQAAVADIENFATGGVTIFISEVDS